MNAGKLISNRYLIQRFLGQGGFGRTYLAYDTQRFGEACVLKEFVPANRGKEVFRKSQELFEREAKILYNVDHPQIPKFISWFTDQQRLFIVQEYIEGKTYSQVLQERLSQTGKPFSEAEVNQWLWDMLPVLDYIHKRNLIHRDISLDNVMLRADKSKPVLIDFGLAKEKISKIWSVNSTRRSSFGSVVGKWGYAPVEQIRRGVCYYCSDIYTLGVCAVVLLTGKAPDLLLDRNFNWRWHSYVKLSEQLTAILSKMLAEKPDDRYQSANEVLRELELPNFIEEKTAISSVKKIEINIDQVKRKHEVAEICASDEFKLIEQKVNNLKNRRKISENISLEIQRSANIVFNQKFPNQNPSSKLKGDLLQTSISRPLEPELIISQIPISQPLEPELIISQTPISQPLNPEFINYCEQELNRIIGPFAHFVVKDILAEYPHIRQEQFIEFLASKISDSKGSQNFKQRIEQAKKYQVMKYDKKKMQGNSVALNIEFIEHCRQELLLCLGPVANFVLDDILDQSPEISVEQLIKALIEAIGDPKQVEKFKKRLRLPKI